MILRAKKRGIFLLPVAALLIFHSLPSSAGADEIEGVKSQIEALQQKVDAMEKESYGLFNTSKFLLSGYTFMTYENKEKEADSFTAGFFPIFLYKLSDNILFESEVEFDLEENVTEVALEYAQIDFILNDYLTLVAGKFLVPFGVFFERIHPAWINKLPSFPIPFQHHGGFVPPADVGVQLRGGASVGPRSKVNYAIYLTNGPTLVTEEDEAGQLEFGNAGDNNSNKAIGGRIGFLPIPNIEVGLSYQRARVGEDNTEFSDIDADLWAVDAAYQLRSNAIKGFFELRGEYVNSNVDPAVYRHFEEQGFGAFKNERKGFYIQAAYRPSLSRVNFLRNVELVYRYTDVDLPEVTFDRSQSAVGVNYYFKENFVMKVAGEFNDENTTPEEANDVFSLQLAYGF